MYLLIIKHLYGDNFNFSNIKNRGQAKAEAVSKTGQFK